MEAPDRNDPAISSRRDALFCGRDHLRQASARRGSALSLENILCGEMRILFADLRAIMM
jgi:hypothetical protein